MKALEPTDLAFFDRAALRITATVQLSAPPDRVFASFAEPSEWLHWFPLMTAARWTAGAPGLGAEREVALTGLGRFRERMIAWQPGQRFAFTMIGSSSPLASRLAEDYQLRGERGGTRVDWVMAATPTTLGNLVATPTRVVMQRLFARGGRNLEHWLSAN
ncbi:MAG TPA: SRPBCC family protein [Kofleriaceae bacterium]|nr:SRPBCC family protein [Kofleriaceae bacterium]